MPKASEKTAKYLGKPKAKERARPRLISDYPLQSITIAGFKSIRDKTTLSLAGLNVIAGANSAGKSSFMQPLLLLKQTLEAGFDPGPLLLDGPHVRFTELSQFLSKPKRGQPDQLSIDLGFSPDKYEMLEAIELRFSKDPQSRYKLQVDANVLKINNTELVLNINTTRDQCLDWFKKTGHEKSADISFFDGRSPFKGTFGADRFFISYFEEGLSQKSGHRFQIPV